MANLVITEKLRIIEEAWSVNKLFYRDRYYRFSIWILLYQSSRSGRHCVLSKELLIEERLKNGYKKGEIDLF